MNIIKYVNPKTGERLAIQVKQKRDQNNLWRLSNNMADADRLMAKRGFVRAGLRWGKRAVVRLFRVGQTAEARGE